MVFTNFDISSLQKISGDCLDEFMEVRHLYSKYLVFQSTGKSLTFLVKVLCHTEVNIDLHSI